MATGKQRDSEGPTRRSGHSADSEGEGGPELWEFVRGGGSLGKVRLRDVPGEEGLQAWVCSLDKTSSVSPHEESAPSRQNVTVWTRTGTIPDREPMQSDDGNGFLMLWCHLRLQYLGTREWVHVVRRGVAVTQPRERDACRRG